MTRYFVTSTGTGIGKTFVTAALAHCTGRPAYKPVISGFTMEEAAGSDTGQLLEAQHIPLTPEAVERISPWRFAAPLAPSMAAAAESKVLDVDAVIGWCKKIPEEGLVEGVGGVMVPLHGTVTVRDWMAALDWPVILVVGTYLGSLSHTLTALSVLKSHRILLHAVVVSESAEHSVGLDATCAALAEFIAKPVHLVPLPRAASWREPVWDVSWI
jgi:dethiobiotin synthetase